MKNHLVYFKRRIKMKMNDILIPEDHKPMLADDAPMDDLDRLPYPMAIMIKYDGVRCLIKNGGELLGRSFKKHANPYLQKHLGRPEYDGFDSEGIVGPDNHPNLVSITSGAFSRKNDKPKENKFVEVKDAFLYVFDDFSHPGTFAERHAQAETRVNALLAADPTHPIKIVPYVIVENTEALLALEAEWLELGYEGWIGRRLDSPYTNKRASIPKAPTDGVKPKPLKENDYSYVRGKRFMEEEGEVLSVEEGFTNTNAAKVNELGHTDRSTKKEGMIPNGMIANLTIRDLKSGETRKVAAGRMTNEEAKAWFEDQTQILRKIIKYKHFPRGVKDKIRFGTFQCIRAPEDMS